MLSIYDYHNSLSMIHVLSSLSHYLNAYSILIIHAYFYHSITFISIAFLYVLSILIIILIIYLSNLYLTIIYALISYSITYSSRSINLLSYIHSISFHTTYSYSTIYLILTLFPLIILYSFLIILVFVSISLKIALLTHYIDFNSLSYFSLILSLILNFHSLHSIYQYLLKTFSLII